VKKQKTLAGTKILFLFGIALVTVFVLLFRKEEHLKTMFNIIPPDRISVLYLQLLVNAHPDDAALRLELARQYTKTGNIDEAHVALEPLLNQQGQQAIEAKLLLLELDIKSYYDKAATDVSRAKDLIVLKEKIGVIADESVPIDLLPTVIQRSLELGRPEIAAKLYERWAGMNNENHFERIKEAGRWYVAAGIPMQAAEIYHKAYASTTDAEQAKQFALLAISALRAADKGAIALTFMKEYLQRFPKDEMLLDEAIKLALATNDPKQALAWGELRLSLNPNSPEQISKQVDLALAAGNLDVAFSLSEHLLILNPKDRNTRERTAQIAEWIGRPDLALNQWLWLVRHDKMDNTAAIDNALRLAKGLYAGETTIEMLTVISKKRALTDTEFNDMVYAYNNASNSTNLIRFLKSYLLKYPKREIWEILAQTQENAGLLSEAITTWQYIGSHFDQPIPAAIHQIELLWHTGQPEAAFSLLVSNQKLATVNDTEFWQLSADLSWELEQSDNALLAYRTLWKSDTANELVAERLVQILKDNEQAQDAVAAASEAYQRFNKPRWLLLAMDTAIQFGLWENVRLLLQTAETDKQQFENLEMYWLTSAQLHTHDRQSQQALADYQQALNVNPASTTARGGVLWILIDQHDNQRLASFLDLWQQDAMTAPSLWGVYGVGLSKLGKDEQALPWFERNTNLNHDDYLWLLSYADVLVKANRVDAALLLRQYVLFNLRAKLQRKSNDFDPDELTKLLQPAYLVLFRNMEGADVEEEIIIQKFSAKGLKNPMARELLIASYLSQENFEAARFWLLRAHAARLQTPVGQRLALALADNDQATLADILSKESGKLTPLDRVEPLKQLNRTDEALAILDNYLQTSDDIGTNQTGLYQYRNELAISQSPQLDIAADMKSLGALDINQNQIRYTLPLSKNALAFQVRHNHLNSTDNELVLFANDEIDLAFEGKYLFQSNYQLQANLGTNLKDQQSLVYGSMGLTSKITNFLEANIRVGIHEISTETAALRALGAKDKVSLLLLTKLTRQSFFQFDIDGHRYLTRQGSSLGDGYKINAIWGYTLFRAKPTWQVRLQGSWEDNTLNDTIPAELSRSLWSPSANMETIVPKSYGTMGVGTTFRYNLTEQNIPRQPYLLVDGWVGWAIPANVLTYTGRIGAGISLFKADVFSVGAFYGSVQGGQPNTAYQGVEAQYSLRF
jgi:polysaccharide biosynthesis protein PelB